MDGTGITMTAKKKGAEVPGTPCSRDDVAVGGGRLHATVSRGKEEEAPPRGHWSHLLVVATSLEAEETVPESKGAEEGGPSLQSPVTEDRDEGRDNRTWRKGGDEGGGGDNEKPHRYLRRRERRPATTGAADRAANIVEMENTQQSNCKQRQTIE